MNAAYIALAAVFFTIAVILLGRARKETDPATVRNSRFAGAAFMFAGLTFILAGLVSLFNV